MTTSHSKEVEEKGLLPSSILASLVLAMSVCVFTNFVRFINHAACQNNCINFPTVYRDEALSIEFVSRQAAIGLVKGLRCSGQVHCGQGCWGYWWGLSVYNFSIYSRNLSSDKRLHTGHRKQVEEMIDCQVKKWMHVTQRNNQNKGRSLSVSPGSW